uniref:Lysozyme n=1 Tax=Amphimedon queenslandica TaxID=400682 RepID=A0A1X7TH29_AMPQE
MMKELIVLFAILAVSFAGECNSYEREKLNEGYYRCVYKDPLGIPTIGVGFNLKKFGARGEIEGVGANYDAVLNGSQCLNDGQIERLFNQDMDTAVSCAEGWLSNWSRLGSGPQSAVSDMAFNMGCATLHEFVGMKTALSKSPPDYAGARASMQGSLWCRQVGTRCSRDVSCMS